MITQLTNTNKRTVNGLAITYTQNEITDDDGNYFEVTRRATHSYEFIGLDRDAAVTLAAIKRAKYARFDTTWIRRTVDLGSYSVKRWMRTDASGRWFWRVKNGATVTLSPEGNRWKVAVDVNEEDVAYSNIQYDSTTGYDVLMGRVNDPVKMFNDHPQFSLRTYDDGDDAGSPIELTGNYYIVNTTAGGQYLFRLYIAGPFVVDSLYVPPFTDIILQRAAQSSGGDISSWTDISAYSIYASDGYIQITDDISQGASMRWYRLKVSYGNELVYSNPIAVSGAYNAD